MKLKICILFTLINFKAFTQIDDNLRLDDTLRLKIFIADGFSGEKVVISLNHVQVFNKLLFSNDIYGLTGDEIEIYSTNFGKRLYLSQPGKEYFLKAEKEIVLEISEGENPYRFTYVNEGTKYLVVYKKGGNIFVSEFSEEPGFD